MKEEIEKMKTENDLLLRENNNLKNQISRHRTVLSSQNSFSTFHQKKQSTLRDIEKMQRTSCLKLNSINSLEEQGEPSLFNQNFVSNSEKTIGPFRIIEGVYLFGLEDNDKCNLLYSCQNQQKMTDNEKHDLVSQVFGAVCKKTPLPDQALEEI